MTTLTDAPTVTVIPGDGIGPEVVAATMRMVDAAGANIVWEEAQAGAKVFLQGIPSGVPADTIESIERTRTVLKGPLATPIGYGEKSANVTLRKLFETFANIRPIREIPGVPTPFTGRGIDLVVVRENVEDLYAGIEHMQTPDVAQCLKLISRFGSQRVSRTALELARAEGRRKVVAATKANIMKFTEGMLQREFLAAAEDYPDLETGHIIVDNCAHQLVIAPEQFDVIVTTNMNGDILSDLTSGLVGGLGFAPSANIGTSVAMFEAVHGSAPQLEGLDVANPTAIALAAVMMLRHVGQFEAAERMEQALFATLEDGIHTADVTVGESVGTTAFTDAVIERMGKTSSTPSRPHRAMQIPVITRDDARTAPKSRVAIGVDVFIESSDDPDQVAENLNALTAGTPFTLKMISNRGTAVWPSAGGNTECIDHFRCRFIMSDQQTEDSAAVLTLLERIGGVYRWMHVEKLETIDDDPGFTRAQGEN